MRLRIRGPVGQSTVTLDDDSSTIAILRKTIESETSLVNFDVKYGYPPKPLSLDQYASETKLIDLHIKLAGEQLIVTKVDPPSTDKIPLKVNEDIKVYEKQNHGNLTGSSRSPVADSSSRPSEATSGTTPGNQDSGPISLKRKKAFDMSDAPEIILPEIGGTLVLRVMPDDNSCLFRAIAAATMPGLDVMTELRSVVAGNIQANPDKYTKVVLDNQKPDEYCRWIQTEDAWGGQIELDILSQHFDIEICSIDVQSLRVDRYNEKAPDRCILVYSGIHYDTIALSLAGMPPDEDKKIFESFIKDEILPEAVRLCKKLQDKHYYTDTAGFKVKCNDCGTICVGEKGAQDHAKKTGHYDFGESN